LRSTIASGNAVVAEDVTGMRNGPEDASPERRANPDTPWGRDSRLGARSWAAQQGKVSGQ